MRRLCVAAVLLTLLSSCSLVPSSDTDGTAVASRGDYCTSVARLRAQDASYNGLDGDMQKRIYARSYADCVAAKNKLLR
ncbi:MAG: hypothetical protein KGJ79_00080 [Alphaproteobacteria bacterium]|nr:hypothetical protein [Alphaproteobacteria bacterium]MDE2109508.1 hypothetical protein [Alphaproteobacteria bacterium]MDE2495092.1 hypothetical protein [Alphaproteobacteria bacterium]